MLQYAFLQNLTPRQKQVFAGVFDLEVETIIGVDDNSNLVLLSCNEIYSAQPMPGKRWQFVINTTEGPENIVLIDFVTINKHTHD